MERVSTAGYGDTSEVARPRHADGLLNKAAAVGSLVLECHNITGAITDKIGTNGPVGITGKGGEARPMPEPSLHGVTEEVRRDLIALRDRLAGILGSL